MESEYNKKIGRVKQFLDDENRKIDQNIDIEKIFNVIIGMAPKVVGTFLEQILRDFYNIDENGNVNSASDGIHQTEDIEVKSSRVLHTFRNQYTNQLERLLTYERRLLSISELTSESFDCNMQQVKPAKFDKIYYGILTKEGFLVFKMNKNVMLADSNITYSDKQHAGNVGEGQFHVKNSNIQYHFLHYYEGAISWYKIFEILKSIK